MSRTVQLNDGKQIPAVGFGNMHGWENEYSQKAEDVPAFALKQGFRHLDTAQVYKTEEETVNAVKAAGLRREDVWITSKIWKNGEAGVFPLVLNTDPRQPESAQMKTTEAEIRASVESSVKRLGGPPDLWLIHNPYIPEPGKIGEFWLILEGLVKDGTLKDTSLGVSNFRPQDLEEVFKVCTIKPAVNQLEYHPYVLAQLDNLLELQRKHGIVTQAYGSLTPIVGHPTGGPVMPVLKRIAEKLTKEHGTEIDEAVVLYLWVRDKGVVPITTSAKESNIAKAALVLTLPPLSAEDMEEIESTGRKIHFRRSKEHMLKDFPKPDLPQDL